MHCLLFHDAMTLGVACYEVLRDVLRWCAAREPLLSNTKWQTKAARNSNLLTKIKKFTGINVLMQRKDIF